MDFIDQLKQFSDRVSGVKDSILTEEATKTSIIMPFFAMLGYDVFNPEEFVPEYTADVGIKKGEKVDYAIVQDGEPVILIEVKSIDKDLQKHDSQLFRYFGTTNAKFAILTNGIIYRFYTDLEETNKMDTTPFMEIDILNIKEAQVPELRKFCKSVFSVDEITGRASVLKYSDEFKAIFAGMLSDPSDEVVRMFLQDVYDGVKTQAVVERFRPILKKALSEYINETVSNKIKAALDTDATPATVVKETPDDSVQARTSESEPDSGAKIVTTEEELEAFFLVKNMLKEYVCTDDIVYKDTTNYFGVLYGGNTRKWICRFRFTSGGKQLILPDEGKKEKRIPLDSLYDIENYKEDIVAVLKRYMEA